MSASRTDPIISVLIAVLALLVLANVGLLIRMNQVQGAVLAALRTAPGAEPPGLGLGTNAPPFQLSDADGRAMTLADFKGSRVFVLFSFTHCPPCIELYSDLKQFSQEVIGHLQVVMISRGSAEELVELKDGFNFPVLIWDDSVARDYQVPGTPFFYLLDENGAVEDKGIASGLEQLRMLAQTRKH